MPSNPITPQEQYDILNNRSLTPRDGVTTDTYMAAGYLLMPPATVDGPIKWRLFDAAYVQTGIIDPNRLGTGATGAGNLYLADDGTWKVISGAPGIGDMLKATYDVDNDGTVDSAERIEIIVRNSTGSTLTKGQVVYLSGATGNRPNALRAQANSEVTSSKTFGFVVADITNNSDGYVACNGTLHDLDTSAFADGDAIWLSPTVAGGWTTTVPSEPNHSVFLGYIARSHPTQGRVVILIKNGYELNELHDVVVPSPANGDLLQWDGVNQYWKNVPVLTVSPIPTLQQVTTAGYTTTNPIIAAQFQINGTTRNARLSSDNVGGFDINYNIGGTPDWRWFGGGTTALTTFKANGNVLIGTTTDAGYKLDVQGVLRVNGDTRFAGNSYITTGDFHLDNDRPIRWKDSAGNYRRAMLITAANDFQFGPVDTGWAGQTYIKSGTAMQFLVNGASGTSTAAITINTSGNVGINTTSPGEKLQVAGNVHISGVGSALYFDTDASPKSIVQYVNNLYELHIYNGRGSTSRIVGASGFISLGSGTTQMLYLSTSSTRVGIGTTSPTRKLTLIDTTTGAGLAIDSSTQSDNYYIEASKAGSSRYSVYENSDVVYINAYGRMVLRANQLGGSTGFFGFLGGNVLINTSTDAGYKLDVNGTLRVQNIPAGATSNGRFLVQASAGGVEYRTAAQVLSDIDVPGYVSSRGENLVTNGTGLRKSNYNFSAFTFVGSDAYYTTGSFRDTVYSSSPTTDEAIPVDVNQRYRLTVSARQNPYVGARYYVGVSLIDADGYPVNASNHMYKANTLTTLAAPLNTGDTVVYLTSAANWENGGTAGVNTHLRSFIFWNYVNSLGYAFPALTYSRNWHGNMWDPGSVNTVTNTITLRVPWPNSTVPAGTQLSNGSSGGTFKYITASNVQIPNAWTTYTGIISGVDTTGTNVTDKFAPGTAAIKILFLNNRDVAGATVYYTNVQFALDTQNPADQILNQNAVVQTANFSISGTGYVGTRLGVGASSSSRVLTVGGDILLNTNNVGLLGKSTGGSDLEMFKIDSSNNIQFGTPFNGAGSIFYAGTLTDWYQYPSSVLTHRMRLSANGNLLIGTTTEGGYRLDVVGGDARINNIRIGLGGGQLTNNLAIGNGALNANTTGGENVAIGSASLVVNTIGIRNIAIGDTSLYSNISGGNNVAIGMSSQRLATNANYNTSIGFATLNNNVSGSSNVAIGSFAGRFISGGATIATSITNSILIGAFAYPLGDSQSNQIVIGTNSVGLGSNTTTIGNSSTVTTAIYGNLLLGTTTVAGYLLDVNGTARVQGSITATLANTVTSSMVYYNSSTGLLTYGALPAPTAFQIDYDYNIVGVKNGVNVVFTTSVNFVLTTTRVYLNGQRLTRGVGYDYVETGTNQVTFANPLNPTDQIIIEYQI